MNIAGEAVIFIMASCWGSSSRQIQKNKHFYGSSFTGKCLQLCHLSLGKGKAAKRDARKLLVVNCERLKLPSFCYGSSGRLCALTLQTRSTEGPMTPWLTTWVLQVDSVKKSFCLALLPCRDAHSLSGQLAAQIKKREKI